MTPMQMPLLPLIKVRSNAEEGEQLSQGIKVRFGCVAQTVTNHRTSGIGIPELGGAAIF